MKFDISIRRRLLQVHMWSPPDHSTIRDDAASRLLHSGEEATNSLISRRNNGVRPLKLVTPLLLGTQ